MDKLLLALLIAAPTLASAQTPLCQRLATETQASPAHWGISIASLDGTPLCAIDDRKLFRPASNAKLFTTAAALAALGGAWSLETDVLGNLDPATGVVAGDLTLVGAGDANLDSHDLPYLHTAAPRAPLGFPALDDLAAQLAAKGVKTVTGDLLGDDSRFPPQPYPEGWELDDLPWGYAAPVSALSLADNQLPLTVTAGTTGPASVALDQGGLAYYSLEGTVGVDPVHPAGVQVQRLPGSHILRLGGSIAPETSAREQVSIDDPAAFAALAFRAALAAHGIAVSGHSRAQHLGPPSGAVLAAHRSAPLAADVTYTNKTSHNLHAELLLHALAPAGGGAAEGIKAVRVFLLQAGIAPEDVTFYDGSGLSSHDLVTPRAVTALLTYAATQPWFGIYKASLPVGGVDGSLAARFPGALKGRVFAKTGSLGETRALSGYLTAASGRTIVFSILDDAHPPGTSPDRTLMDRIVEEIAAAN